jgi:hypothetical protein
MKSETLTDEAGVMETAWQAFQYWTGTRDADYFQRSYLGHYADREAFGQELLGRLGAEARLARLPAWLRGYLRFDGAAVVADFEAVGQFHIVDTPAGGSFVFDAYEQPAAVVESASNVELLQQRADNTRQ